MPLQPFDIHLVRLRVGESNDLRPCVILSEPDQSFARMMPISSSDLFNPSRDFRIHQTHPDFPKTGLKKTSFVIGDRIREVSLVIIEKRLGSLEGALRREFEEWLG